ncbi:MAG: hypothetical protein HY826_00370 [Actinobacteria bacterium]|nr:hypothetical protein [Actinomycetota bacterium]
MGGIDPDKIELIDLIEFDPDAFGSQPRDGSALEDQARSGHNRRQRIVAGLITSVVGLILAGLPLSSEWHHGLTLGITVMLPDGAPPEVTLTDELVFGTPPAPLNAASLGTAASDAGLIEIGSDGYVFAEPGAYADINGRSDGRWAVFLAVEANSEVAPDLGVGDGQTNGMVQGSPAVISHLPGTTFRVDFGPIDGRIFTVTTTGLSRTESLALAEAVGISGGLPVLRDPTVLGAMEPLGDIADYVVATSTVFEAASPVGGQRHIASAHYGGFETGLPGNGAAPYSLASQPVVGQTTLAMLRFFLDGENGHSVHGQPAVVADTATSGLAIRYRSIGITGGLGRGWSSDRRHRSR